jgi:hypothetical protein
VNRRVGAAIAAVSTVAAGLAVRGLFDGVFAKVAGVVLYAVLIYELIVVIAPRMAVTTVAALALAVCWVVEFAQLTPGPAALSELHPALALVFGSTFSAWDLPAYTLGVFVAVLGDRLARSPRRRPVTG